MAEASPRATEGAAGMGHSRSRAERRVRLMGVWVDALTMDETVAGCAGLVEARVFAQHVVLNAGKMVMIDRSPGLRRIVEECDMVSADGQSVVWAARLLGSPVPERVTGIDLMDRLLDAAAERGWSVYFLGAQEATLREFVRRVKAQRPSLSVAGYRDGYFDDDEATAQEIARSGARLLFVGMPSPRKEEFLAEQGSRLGPLLAVGVGGSFDVVAGLVRRAPLWAQRAGLEWLYRFMQEPGRLWRRYLVGNIVFVSVVVREMLRGGSSHRDTSND